MAEAERPQTRMAHEDPNGNIIGKGMHNRRAAQDLNHYIFKALSEACKSKSGIAAWQIR